MSALVSRVVTALGSLAVATALSGATALAGQQPAFAPSAPAPPPPAATCKSFCAVIRSDGFFVRGHAFTTSTHLGTGIYQVLFNVNATTKKNISNCAWIITPGLAGFSGTTPATIGTVVGRSGTTNGLFVEMFDATGAPVDSGFHALVSC
jgi:hypothetical protein